jgi:hypothetical protein
MTHPDDTIKQETTPTHVTPGYKRLKFIVIFMGVLIVIGLGVIITTVVYRAFNSGSSISTSENVEIINPENTSFGDLTIHAPAGGVLKSVNGSGSLIYLHFSTPNGDVVKVLETRTGLIQGSLQIKPAK